jgi:nicotinate-nucleotide--dimethylbenzimidazole phosphoribosyltransferase
LAELGEWIAGTAGHWPVPLRRVGLIHAGRADCLAARLADAAGVGRHELIAGGGDDAVADGIDLADGEIEAGAELFLLAARDDGPAPAVVVSLLAGAEPVALLPRGADAVDSAAWISAAEQLRDGRRAALPLRREPARLATALGSPVLAAATGFLLRATARRTPVVLDGSVAAAAALLAFELRPRAVNWWRFADAGTDAVTRRVVEHVGQRPLLDLGGRGGDGVAALLALSLVRAAATTDRAERLSGGDA